MLDALVAQVRPISTHAPRTGSDEDVTHWFRRSWRFQPTLPARGATEIRARLAGVRPFQPTLPARGATALGNGLLRRRLGISTHAPRTGSDHCTDGLTPQGIHFNPRSPHGERRRKPWRVTGGRDFNPRSPHGERRKEYTGGELGIYFNPRSPHGERRAASSVREVRPLFQPTLPARGATKVAVLGKRADTNFNPRSPHGERRRRK